MAEDAAVLLGPRHEGGRAADAIVDAVVGRPQERDAELGIELLVGRRDGLFHRAHPDDAAGQPVGAAAYQVGLVESLAQPRVPIVRQPGVHLEVQMRAAQLLVGIFADDDGLLGHHPLVRSEDFAGGCGLLRGDQIRVRAVGHRAGQLDHLGAQGGK